MPLRNHFDPINQKPGWGTFHSAWTTMLAQRLNHILPAEYRAYPQNKFGPEIEIDVATLAIANADQELAFDWKPEPPSSSTPISWPENDHFEIRVVDASDGSRLVGAIELVSPANKDRPTARDRFTAKCLGYLRNNIGLVIVDVVTNRHSNLHDQLTERLELDEPKLTWPEGHPPVYAVAYRTYQVLHDKPFTVEGHIEIWHEALELGKELPTLPLWLTAELSVPIELEASYQATCNALRM